MKTCCYHLLVSFWANIPLVSALEYFRCYWTTLVKYKNAKHLINQPTSERYQGRQDNRLKC
jgi:hypothetical protein